MKHRDPLLKALLGLTVLSLWGLLLRPLWVPAPAQAQGQPPLKLRSVETPRPAIVPAPVGRFHVDLDSGPRVIVRNANNEPCWYRVSNQGPNPLKLSADWNGRPVLLQPDECVDLEIRTDLSLVSDDARGWYERIH